MKHDIPLLKSDLDFGRLAALCTFQCSCTVGSQTVEV